MPSRLAGPSVDAARLRAQETVVRELVRDLLQQQRAAKGYRQAAKSYREAFRVAIHMLHEQGEALRRAEARNLALIEELREARGVRRPRPEAAA